METLTVYTTVYGPRTDKLSEPKCESDVRFVCFTDQQIKSERWEIIRVPPAENPLEAARLSKALSHELIGTPWSLWVDANFTVMVDPAELLDFGRFVNFRHPDRDRIRQEAVVIERLGFAKWPDLKKQFMAYRAEGFDTDENPQRELSANGVILRHHTPEVIAVNIAWAKELQTYTLRDQMSLDYVCWKQNFKLDRWPGHYARSLMFLYKNGRHLVRRQQRQRVMLNEHWENKRREMIERRRKLAERNGGRGRADLRVRAILNKRKRL
ncbi:MAG: glycosyltransferase domain-containing protein [Gammaproteobacteria bacterium]